MAIRTTVRHFGLKSNENLEMRFDPLSDSISVIMKMKS